MPTLDFDRYLPFILGALYRRLSRGASRLYLDRHGINLNEWRILASLAAKGRITPMAVCQYTGIDRSSVSRATEKMEKDGLIVNGSDKGDARMRPMQLTKKGRGIHDKIVKLALERERRILEPLSASERDQLIESLRKIQSRLPYINSEQKR